METNTSVNFDKECFIVMPMAKTSPTALFDEIYKYIIKPAVEEEAGMFCVRVDEILKPGSIIQDIVEHLSKSNAVIADLTGQNPNVFYEVGVRDALRGRMIFLAQNINDVPFDLRGYRVCIYDVTSPRGYHEAKQSIVNYLKELKKDPDLKGSTVREFLFREGLQQLTETPDFKEGTGLNLLVKDIHSTLAVSQSVNSQTLNKLSEFSQHLEIDKALNDAIKRTLESFTPGLITDIEKRLSEIQTIIQTFSKREDIGKMYDQFGIESVHRTRLDAIEHSFYKIMDQEQQQIDIVGSTIFGLKGHSYATNERIVDLLKSKRRDPKFTIRLLLTHHEILSLRQAQERNEKRPDRWVISKEAVDAVEVLKRAELLDSVKFYKGSPTCFTIVCHGEGRMLLNPYPYEREAFNSWSLIIRNIPNSIYNDFLLAHIEKPWTDELLVESYSSEYQSNLDNKYQEDVKEFYETTRPVIGKDKVQQKNLVK